MNKSFLFFFLLFESVSGTSQKLYSVLKIKPEFAGISYADKHVKEEFRTSVPKINIYWGIDIFYRKKKVTHKFSLEESALEKNFKIINKFLAPPNTGVGFAYGTYGTGINHLIVGYSLHREAKNEKGFLFHTRIRFNYSFGLGLSFNRSKAFYREVDAASNGGFQTPITYHGYEAVHYRNGFGLFFKSTGGFDFINRKGKRRFCFNLFYNQGLKQMVLYNIHYQYGYFNDPQKQVDVPNQVLKNRGTTFGFSIGLPITIKK